MYQHEIDALNALVIEQRKTNELLSQLLAKIGNDPRKVTQGRVRRDDNK